MSRRPLTEQQEAEAQKLAQKIQQQCDAEFLELARDMVAREDHELLGSGEFAVRDRVHRMGAKAIEIAVNDRKKGV